MENQGLDGNYCRLDQEIQIGEKKVVVTKTINPRSQFYNKKDLRVKPLPFNSFKNNERNKF